MRSLLMILLFYLVYSVSSTSNVQALTKSMGQEVIEISSPIRGLHPRLALRVLELPQELEEEPSAEVDDEETTTLLQPATRREVRKSTVGQPGETRRRGKDIDKIDNAQEDEEARIEKELAEIYKDNVDYKADSAEVTKEAIRETKEKIKGSMKEILKEIVNNTLEEKPIARSRTNFQFQPEGKDVERWRTSVDEITCDRSYTKRLVLPDAHKSAFRFTSNLILLVLLFTIGYCCDKTPF